MTTMNYLIIRSCRSPLVLYALVSLVVLAWASPARCGEIHEAAKRGDVAKIKALLQADASFSHNTTRAFVSLRKHRS